MVCRGRGHEDDRGLLALLEELEAVLYHEEDALKVDVHHLVEGLLRLVEERTEVEARSSVQGEDVDAPKLLFNELDVSLTLRRFPYMESLPIRIDPEFLELGHGLHHLLSLTGGDYNSSSFYSEATSGSEADP